MGLSFRQTFGQTVLSEEDKDGLLIPYVSTLKELDELEQQNIEKAMEWSLSSRIRSEILFQEMFVLGLHKRMFGDVWDWAGSFRRSDKNIGVNWTRIGVDLKALLDDLKYWFENDIYAPDEAVIRFKHRLVSIHCFPNGNGRHSRLIADILIDKLYEREPFSWGSLFIGSPERLRKEYLDALHRADDGEFSDLMEFARS